MTEGRSLLHVCGRYLPLSETFTYDLITGVRPFEHHVIAASLENIGQFPLPSVHVSRSPERPWGLARELNPSAIVCHFGPQATTGMSIALALNRPAATIFHGYDVSRLLRDPRWVERFRAVCAGGMQALCISHAGRSRLIEIGWSAAQIDVIHLGVDTKRFAFVPPVTRWGPGRSRRILMVARLVPKKGVDVALDAIRRLKARNLEVELRIVGEGPERRRLEAQIDRWGLSHVSLLGALGHERTRQEFTRADIYIQPSVTAASGDQEGIPVSLMEAQSSGLPVVATRHSGIPELVLDGETGLLTDEANAEELAVAIERLVGDRDGAQRLAEGGRARVECEFDRDRQARRFTEYFESLAERVDRGPLVSLDRRLLPTRRGLVIRSIPFDVFARKLLLLSFRHPDVQWDVLTSRSSAPEVGRLPQVHGVWTYGDGRLSLGRLGADTLRGLQDASYSVAVVLYDDRAGMGFANVRRVARAVGARRGIALMWSDRETSLPRARPRPPRPPRDARAARALSGSSAA